jgi:hypothetical protein
MKVLLERSGGFTGVRRTVEVDTTALGPERAAELAGLVERSGVRSAEPAAAPPCPGRPDRFSYRLTLEEEAGARTLTLGEDALTPELAQLIEWLQEQKP